MGPLNFWNGDTALLTRGLQSAVEMFTVGFNSVTVVRTLFEHSSCTTKPFLGFPKCTEVCGYCCALDFMIRCDIKLIAGRWYIRVAIPDKICCRMATCGLRGCKNGPAPFPRRLNHCYSRRRKLKRKYPENGKILNSSTLTITVT